jgi:membrane protease YdiL (CAAX protease family)
MAKRYFDRIAMNQLTCWVDGHQLVAFFAVSFTISWGLLISFGPLYASGVVLVVPVLMLALFGPALAGIIVSAVIRPEPKQATTGKRLLTFVLTWMVATPVFVFSPELTREGRSVSVGLVVVSALIALIPAFIVSSAFSRTPGVRALLEPLVKPRGHVVWYITAVLIVPALLALSMVLMLVLGKEITAPRIPVDGGWPNILMLVTLSAAYRFFYANACGEEPGWRGFALPRLQARFSPLVANLVLAFFWALWHLPLPQARGLASPVAFLEYYVGTLAHCIMIAWLFNHTRGGILAAGLLHVFSNVSRLYLPETTAFLFMRPGFCVLLILKYKMWKRPADGRPVLLHSDHGGG